jgi:hypothetical protein
VVLSILFLACASSDTRSGALGNSVSRLLTPNPNWAHTDFDNAVGLTISTLGIRFERWMIGGSEVFVGEVVKTNETSSRVVYAYYKS